MQSSGGADYREGSSSYGSGQMFVSDRDGADGSSVQLHQLMDNDDRETGSTDVVSVLRGGGIGVRKEEVENSVWVQDDSFKEQRDRVEDGVSKDASVLKGDSVVGVRKKEELENSVWVQDDSLEVTGQAHHQKMDKAEDGSIGIDVSSGLKGGSIVGLKNSSVWDDDTFKVTGQNRYDGHHRVESVKDDVMISSVSSALKEKSSNGAAMTGVEGGLLGVSLTKNDEDHRDDYYRSLSDLDLALRGETRGEEKPVREEDKEEEEEEEEVMAQVEAKAKAEASIAALEARLLESSSDSLSLDLVNKLEEEVKARDLEMQKMRSEFAEMRKELVSRMNQERDEAVDVAVSRALEEAQAQTRDDMERALGEKSESAKTDALKQRVSELETTLEFERRRHAQELRETQDKQRGMLLRLMRLGSTVVKYDFNGSRSRSVRIAVSEDCLYIVWGEWARPTKHKEPVSNIVRLQLGCESEVFLRRPRSQLDPAVSLSISLPERTLDLSFPSPSELELWVSGLSLLRPRIPILTTPTSHAPPPPPPTGSNRSPPNIPGPSRPPPVVAVFGPDH